MSQNLVDLHCHILPGIDDGARDLNISMALLRKEIQDGVAGIVFTPHFHYERISVENFAAKRRAAFLQVAKAAKETACRWRPVGCGGVLYNGSASLDLRALALPKSNYILIEFPTTCHPAGIDETLYAVRQRGYTPILAHVERYPFVTEDPTLLYNWVSEGCLAQINASGPGAGRPHGPLAAKIAEMEPGASALHRLPLDRHPPAKPESRVQQAATPHRPPPAPQQH